MLTEDFKIKTCLLDLIKDSEKKFFRFENLSRGQIIFHENEECQELGLIIKGEVVISSYTYHGEEIVYNLLKENDVFGNNLIFSSDPHYRGNIIVNKPSKVAFITRQSLLTLLRQNESFLTSYLQVQSDFGKRLNATIKLLSFSTAEERFLYYLFLNNNRLNFSNVTSLAKEVFVKRETLSRLLSKLTKDKKITRYRNLIIYNEKSR